MAGSGSTKHAGSIHTGVLWLALLIGLIVQFRITIRQFDTIILVTLFDAVVPILTIFGVTREWIEWPWKRLQLIVIAAITVIVMHSVTVYVLVDDVNVAWLIKASLKHATLIFLFACLLMLFQRADFRSPSCKAAISCLIVATPVLVLVSKFEPFYIARTIQGLTLLGLLFLIAQDGKWVDSGKRRLQLMFAAFVAAAACLMLQSKTSAGIALIFAVWFLLGTSLADVTARKAVKLALVVLLIVAAGIGVTYIAGGHFDPISRIDTVQRSIDVRLNLWSVALTTLLDTFPLGVGFGQFAEVLKTAGSLAVEDHKFPHNSLLGLSAELGFVGLLASGLIVWAVYCGAKAWPSAVAPLFVILVVPPLVLHDGHSIRMLLVVTALGLARFLYGSEDVARSRGT